MMRLIFLFMLLSSVCFGQSQRISEMTNAGALAGTEFIPVVQSGANRKATPAQLSTYVNGLYGSGVSTWLVTPSWTNFNSMITGTAPYWPLSGSATLTGNTTISGGGFNLSLSGLGITSFGSASSIALTFTGTPISSFTANTINVLMVRGLSPTQQAVRINDTHILIQDDLADVGLVGSKDYSANYNDSSYVQKLYVDGVVSGADFWPLTGTGTLTGDVTIAGDFNVGIGASPAFKLDVAGTVDNDNIFRLRDNNLSTIMNVFEQTGETTINIQPTNLNMVGSDATLRQIDITNQGAGTMRVDIQAEAGDVDVSFNIVGTDWVMGVDNSDSDAFKIATGSALGTNDVVALTTTGVGQAGGLKHQRVTTGSIGASSSAAVTLTWTNAFADANYTVNVSIVQADTDDQTLMVDHIESISATQVVVRVVNEDAGAAKTGTLHFIAMHD